MKYNIENDGFSFFNISGYFTIFSITQESFFFLIVIAPDKQLSQHSPIPQIFPYTSALPPERTYGFTGFSLREQQ